MNNYKIKPWEELTFKDDYIFKKVMSEKRHCKKLLEKLLRIKIRDLKYLEDEKTLKSTYISKGVRLDVYVEDDKNTIYDIEMQVRSLQDDELFKRTRYYQSVIDTDLLSIGALYSQLKQTFIIFICPFELFDAKRHLYTFKNICVEDKNIIMEDGATKVLISTKGTADDVTPDVKAFLNYIDGELSKDDFVAEIDTAVQNLKTKESERMNYMTYAMKILEEREEGREEGRNEGRNEGRIESIRNLMKTTSMTADPAMDALLIPQAVRAKISSML